MALSHPLFDMVLFMDYTHLITSVKIDDIEYKINTDFRDILEIFQILNDPDLLDVEKSIIAFENFYVDKPENVEQGIKEMYNFMTMNNCEDNSPSNKNEKPLFDWEQDFNLIIAPINRTLNFDVRSAEYLHWWTFLSAFMEIGECTFNTYVGIRDKLNKNKKLEKYEKQILKEHRKDIILKQKVDTTTQALMDEILGV